jgi:hypothetical protein
VAEEVQIAGGPETAKIRNVIAVPVLCVITLGIYLVVWWYKINREMADLGRKHNTDELGTNPMLSALALFPGSLLIVPAVWTTITTYQRMKRAQQLVGIPETNQGNPWIYGVSYVAISVVAYGYLQNELNKIWSAAVPAPVAAQPPAAPPAPPEPPAPPAPPAPPIPPST